MQTRIYSDYKPWLVCLGAALFFYFVFFQLAMFNSISNAVMQDFHIDTTRLGYLSSSYFFADALCIIPAGMLLDRYSTRHLSLIIMAACVIATFLFAITHSFYIALFCRVINGIGNAFAFLSSMQLAARWLPSKRLALGIGLIITIIMIGGIIAQTPLVLLVSWIGWRGATVVNALLGLLFLLYMYRYIEDYPAGEKPVAHHVSTETIFLQFKQAVKNQQNWFCASYTTLMNFPIILLGELWGIMYLSQAKGLSSTQASNVTSMLFIGMIIGSPLLGWISDTCQRRRSPMIISSIILFVTTLFVIFNMHPSMLSLSISFFLLGLLASGQVISYPLIAESNSQAITGTAMSIVAILLNLVSFVVQPLFGWLVHLGWNGQMQNNTPIYSGHDFSRAMWLLPIACIISVVLAYRLRETYAKKLVAAGLH